jgi:hypothetical protein
MPSRSFRLRVQWLVALLFLCLSLLQVSRPAHAGLLSPITGVVSGVVEPVTELVAPAEEEEPVQEEPVSTSGYDWSD